MSFASGEHIRRSRGKCGAGAAKVAHRLSSRVCASRSQSPCECGYRGTSAAPELQEAAAGSAFAVQEKPPQGVGSILLKSREAQGRCGLRSGLRTRTLGSFLSLPLGLRLSQLCEVPKGLLPPQVLLAGESGGHGWMRLWQAVNRLPEDAARTLRLLLPAIVPERHSLRAGSRHRGARVFLGARVEGPGAGARGAASLAGEGAGSPAQREVRGSARTTGPASPGPASPGPAPFSQPLQPEPLEAHPAPRSRHGLRGPDPAQLRGLTSVS
nr:uncharacterized protein LOC129056751 [Pongo abelii]